MLVVTALAMVPVTPGEDGVMVTQPGQAEGMGDGVTGEGRAETTGVGLAEGST